MAQDINETRENGNGLLTVGIIGMGSVGSATTHALSRYHTCVGFDIVGKYSWDDILSADIAFICVPTPIGKDDRLDCSAIDIVLEDLNKSSYDKLVVIKSTVAVGYMERAVDRFPHLRLVYMPEFLRERNCYSWCMDPDRILVSGKPQDIEEALRYFSWARNAEILRMSHADAEIGKLAHNAFIAVKVSFTNEMEAISVEHGADPEKVMSVIWADRRVKCREHLTPGLGPYGGKCVPKDTKELMMASTKGWLLKATETLNQNIERPAWSPSLRKVAVVVPTLERGGLLERALASIAAQTRHPEIVVLVYDGENGPSKETVTAVASYKGVLDIRILRNTHAQNLSGAVNTALEELLRSGAEPADWFVSFLDDDDWYDRRYIENCLKFAHDLGPEWVISGLVRYDDTHPEGLRQVIPEQITVGDFIVGNPNVQGSNLFVLLSRLLQVGGFDENLPSTTDRDICIRLLKVEGIKVDMLRNHLVHHDAHTRSDRLSHPGSEKKAAGLVAFYGKYGQMMDESQRAAFKDRANRLFSVEL